jgi:hypothetical protein
MTVLFSPFDSTVAGFDIKGPEFMTVRGLRVGDSRQRVRQLYGDAESADTSDLQFDDPSEEGRVIIALLRVGVVWRVYVGLIFD